MADKKTQKLGEAYGKAELVDDSQALAPRGETALAEIPDWMQGAVEDAPIKAEDMRMPRLAIAQGLSPAMIPGKPEYNEDLKLGQLFNSLTGDIYGKGPLMFAIAKRYPPRWVQFDDERNMVDPNVDPNDEERTSWRTDPETGERRPPIATKFLDYVIVLLDTMEPIALSCARSNIKAASSLNGLIQMRKPRNVAGKPIRIPEFGMKFTVETAMVPGPNNSTYGVFVFKNAGDLLNEPETAAAMRAFHDSFATKVIDIDRERHDEAGPSDSVEQAGGDASFDTSGM
jgi:hypothetical protein